MERTVVLGCGEAGLIAAATLERADETDVVVVSERDFHVFSFLLYDVLEGKPFADACLDLRSVFRETDVTFVQGVADGVDVSNHTVELRSGALSFDTLLIAVGGVTAYSIDDRRHVSDIRTDAREIRDGVRTPDVRDVVIVGGGPVGVETAATLSAISEPVDATLSAISEPVDATLLTSSHRLLPDFPPRASRLAERHLRRRSVDVRSGARVNDVTENRVVLDGGRAERSDLTIWAGGVRPNPVIQRFGLPVTDRGLRVDPFLRCDGADDVYAAGDVIDYPGKVNDGYSAGLEARTAAKNVVRGVRGRRPREHDVRWHPRIVHLGGNAAIIAIDGIVHAGRGPALLRTVAVESYPFLWKALY
ncbi:NAD(P)/FAD-dependent oxidoreductase [Natrinema caseinilyticum]|uniref:NAD(P)/FAD-dependent oxidoreductase n=1 Tax=Natrinema caseinilyticum TaxID=2961570 RepID=UPI0020C58138|nr:FAD-dependent oxidoreductase [Natrinema caseinilyticum]